MRRHSDLWVTAFDAVTDPVCMHDSNGRIVRANPAYSQRAGLAHDEILGRNYWEVFPRLPGPLPHRFDEDGSSDRPDPQELRLETGAVWRAQSFPAFDKKGDSIATILVLHAVEQEHHRLNRSLRLLSACNSALVRAKDESTLLEDICGLIVTLGRYRMAWVGFARHDELGTVVPVARAGADEGYIDAQQINLSAGAGRDEPTAAAIRNRKSVLVGEPREDRQPAPWKTRADEHGYASILAMPIEVRGKTVGALSIYSADSNAFDADELKLLDELCADLGYGIGSLRVAAERDRLEQELEYQNNYDTLTALPNRNLFEERLRMDLIHASRHGRAVAVALIDIDRFQTVNDTLGHGTGDALLMQLGQNVTACLREGDTVARFAGDEFAVSLSDVANADETSLILRRLQEAIAQPLEVGGRAVSVSASIGISLFPKDGDDLEQLLNRAEHAMYDAKSMGGNTFRFYAPETNERMSMRFALEVDLRRAIDHDELFVHYQPKVSLTTGEMTGAEVLVRWQHPQRGLVPPTEFIPLAESTGMIEPLGEWVLHAVCAQVRRWLDSGTAAPAMAVNLSAHQFRNESLVPSVKRALDSNHVEADSLEMEITESVLMGDVSKAVATLTHLRSLGLKLALDDFGTGYSSLSYLKRFPINALKIDRAFVQDITTDPDDAAICVAVIDLAHNLKLDVIAEGVESDGQMHYLRRHQCDQMQGYFFSRPLPAADFEALLIQSKSLTLPPRDGPAHTLLLVDDEPSVLSALKRTFRADDYRILIATGAREALELLAIHEVQVVVSDQRMTEMSGTEFLERVRNMHPDTIRIVLSGYTDLKTLTDAINRGAIYKFLTKPWEADMLREHVRDAFRHHELGRRVRH